MRLYEFTNIQESCECGEQLTELNPGTLNSYLKKAPKRVQKKLDKGDISAADRTEDWIERVRVSKLPSMIPKKQPPSK